MDEVDALIDGLIEREGGYVNNPADKGGPTCFGITEAVARAHGYRGAMKQLPRVEAAAIYRRLYWLRPRLDEVAKRSARVAAELFDTGVNMGPAVAVTFLQRALTALNRNAGDYPDLVPDGRIGPATLAALDRFLALRGGSSCGRPQPRQPGATAGDPQGLGETVLLRAFEALQGERYLRLAERRPANEAFLYGWLANRIGERWAIIYLTKRDSPSTHRLGYEPDEIEITDAMIAAGVIALERLAGGILEQSPYSPELLVRELLEASLFVSTSDIEWSSASDGA